MMHARHPGPHLLRLCITPTEAYRAGLHVTKGSYGNDTFGATTTDPAAVTCPSCINKLAGAVEKTLAPELREEGCELCCGTGEVPINRHSDCTCPRCEGSGTVYT